MKTKFGIGLALTLLLLISCATFSATAYKTLGVGYQTYDAVMSSLGELNAEGKLTAEQRHSVIGLGRIYLAAHNEAVKALAWFELEGGAESKDAYKTAAVALGDALAEFLAYCRPIIEGSE